MDNGGFDFEQEEIPVNQLVSVKEYRLFYPKTGHDLRFQYPELLKYDEFKGLSQRELLLVWYFANKTSPLDGIDDDTQRMTQAILRSGYENGHGKTGVDDLKRLRFDQKLEKAIYKMASFQPDMRIDAMMIMVKTIANASIVSDMSPEDHRSDASKVKALMEIQTKMAKDVIELVKISEQNFGLSRVEESSTGEDSVDDFDLEDFVQNTHNK